mmetsp:Transcript_3479/g.10115  ORF Transcript_3479/g.10115 Transcript_3479/m.10115 type:complete len:247 (+) Transcript_3479:478-1218(+)
MVADGAVIPLPMSWPPLSEKRFLASGCPPGGWRGSSVSVLSMRMARMGVPGGCWRCNREMACAAAELSTKPPSMRRGRGKAQVRSTHSAGSRAMPAHGAMSARCAVRAAVHCTVRPVKHWSTLKTLSTVEFVLVISLQVCRTSEQAGSGSCRGGASTSRSERESMLPATPASERAECRASTASSRRASEDSSSEVSSRPGLEAARGAGSAGSPPKVEYRARTRLTCEPRKPPKAELKAATRQMGIV